MKKIKLLYLCLGVVGISLILKQDIKRSVSLPFPQINESTVSGNEPVTAKVEKNVVEENREVTHQESLKPQSDVMERLDLYDDSQLRSKRRQIDREIAFKNYIEKSNSQSLTESEKQDFLKLLALRDRVAGEITERLLDELESS